MSSAIDSLFQTSKLFIHQIKEWGEILSGFEFSNKYEILSEQSKRMGLIAERSSGIFGFLKRSFFRSHRPLNVEVFNSSGTPVLHLSRKFFFFVSDLHVSTPGGQKLGSVHRRWVWLSKHYDLVDARGNTFAQIKSKILQLWKFPIFNHRGQELGVISKKWKGLLQEAFTDADTFLLDLGSSQWTPEQKAVLLAAAMSIDFDFFEENQARR